MYRWDEKPMASDLQAELLQVLPLIPSPFKPFKKYKYGLKFIAEAFGAVLALVIILWFGRGDVSAVFAIPTALGFLMFWWLLHLRSRVLNPLREWREANASVCKFHEAVKAAKFVNVCSVETDSAVQVIYDEGTICLFDVGENQTFWVDPYCMIPGKPPAKWPNQKFEILKIPSLNEEIGPFCFGKTLRVKQTIEFRNLFERYEFNPPENGLIMQSLEGFLHDAKIKNQLAS